MKAKRFCLFVLALCFVGMASPRALAQSVGIQEVQTLTFPTLSLPSGGSESLTINPSNSGTSGNAQIISGMASRGKYALSLSGGGSPSLITINISGVSTGNGSLTLGSFSGLYDTQTISNFPSQSLPLPATSPSNTPLYLGATITALPSLPAGTYNVAFNITVFVQ
jgi:hypothetical protein